MRELILIPTRQCNLRCSYCPTVKDGWPSLTPAAALRAIDFFLGACGSGSVKLFGGEPLLAPDVVEAVRWRAAGDPRIESLMLCTNGIGLNEIWLERIRVTEKLIVALSLDGTAEDNRRFRRQLVDEDAYDHIAALAPRLSGMPRVIVTQVIPPATVSRAHLNFQHLLGLGFRRFKIVPAYYVPWSEGQLQSLRRGFSEIARTIRSLWADGKHVYIRNLFSISPQPQFNTALTVDADGRIYATDFVQTDIGDETRAAMCVGTIEEPPSLETVSEAATRFESSLPSWFAPSVWRSTQLVDAELTRFCHLLYPAWRQWRKLRAQAPVPVPAAPHLMRV